MTDADFLMSPANQDAALIRDEHTIVVGAALDTLRLRERVVIRRRFGIGYDGEHSLKSIAEDFGVSSARIRQIEIVALRKLRRPSRIHNAIRSLHEGPSGWRP